MPATPFLAVCFPNMKHSYVNEKRRKIIGSSDKKVLPSFPVFHLPGKIISTKDDDELKKINGSQDG